MTVLKEKIIRYETDGHTVKCMDAGELIRCKDCKHRPRQVEENVGNRLNLEFPDYRCPCRCEDGWYNWMPDDDWFCGNAERKEE